MRCLTVCQPWAWAIIHGPKRIENRTWFTPYRGPLAIHAGKSRKWLESEDRDGWRDLYGVQWPEDLTFGAILGVVDLVDCVRLQDLTPQQRTPWVEGPVCWVLANPRPLARPVPFSGAQGLWNVADTLLR